MAKLLSNIVEVDPIIALGSIHTPKDDLRDQTMKISDTSKKIRFLSSNGKTTTEIYKLLKVYGVTTKNGGEIRYQHVRNVLMTRLSN